MYKDPILHKIIDLLDEYGPKDLRGRWTVGDSMNVPKGALPHGFVYYENEAVSDIAQGELRSVYTVIINVSVDMTRELTVQTDRSESHEQIVRYLSAKNPDTFLIEPSCVLGVLRAHQDLMKDKNLWIEVDSETSIEYGVGAEKRGPNIVSAEGLLRFRITHEQVIPPYGA